MAYDESVKPKVLYEPPQDAAQHRMGVEVHSELYK